MANKSSMGKREPVDLEGAKAAADMYGFDVVNIAIKESTKAMAEDQFNDPRSTPESKNAASSVFQKLTGQPLGYIEPQDPITSANLSLPDGEEESFLRRIKVLTPLKDIPDKEGDNTGIGGMVFTKESQLDYSGRQTASKFSSSLANLNKNLLPKEPGNNSGMA